MKESVGSLRKLNVDLAGIESALTILKTENLTIDTVRRLIPHFEKYVGAMRCDLSDALAAVRSLV